MDNFSAQPPEADIPTLEETPRERKRESIFLGAQVLFKDAKAAVATRVRNISAEGMMVDSVKAHAKGSPVTATIKGIGEVTGHVAWSTGNRVGIQFDEPVDPKEARQTPKGEAPALAYNRPYLNERRPGLAVR